MVSLMKAVAVSYNIDTITFPILQAVEIKYVPGDLYFLWMIFSAVELPMTYKNM